jgi:hypothetical protein
MKALHTIIFLFVAAVAFGQEAYILDKKGNKTIIREDAVDIIHIDKRISYKLPGKTWEKYITYKDLDLAVFGPYRFKGFTIDNKKTGYFVIAEDGIRKLAGLSITVTTTQGSMSTTRVYNYLYVIENDTTVIYDLLLRDLKNNKNRAKRLEIPEKIKEYFPNCTALLSRVDALSKDSDEDFLSILALVETPIYINCN